MNESTKSRTPRQRRPHQRSVVVVTAASPECPLTLIRLTQDGDATLYWVEALASDFGLAYRIEKHGRPFAEDLYDVLLTGEPQGDSCTCEGHTYGHYCRHVDALRALLSRGKLPLPPVAPDQDQPGPDLHEGEGYKPGHSSDLPF